jgi:hypothetical protein
MSYPWLRFQYKTDKVSALLQALMKTVPLCIQQTFPFPDALAADDELIVDHVEIDETHLQSGVLMDVNPYTIAYGQSDRCYTEAYSNGVEIRQDVKLYFASMVDLRQKNGNPPSVTLPSLLGGSIRIPNPLSMTLIFSFTLAQNYNVCNYGQNYGMFGNQNKGNWIDPTLCIEYSDYLSDDLDNLLNVWNTIIYPTLKQQNKNLTQITHADVSATLQNTLSTRTTTIDLAELQTKFANSPNVGFTNVGMALSSDQSILEIRFDGPGLYEFGGSGADWWDLFFSGKFDSQLGSTNDWSVFFIDAIFEDIVIGLAESVIGQNFLTQHTAYPIANWQNVNGISRLIASYAPSFSLGLCTVTPDIEVTIDITVPSQNDLQLDVTTNVSFSDGENNCLGLPIGWLLNPLGSSFANGVGSAIAQNILSSVSGLTKSFTGSATSAACIPSITHVGSGEYSVDLPCPPPPLTIGGTKVDLNIMQGTGVDIGFVISGTQSSNIPDLTPAFLDIHPSNIPGFSWIIDFLICNGTQVQNWQNKINSYIFAYCEIDYSNDGQEPLNVCSVTVGYDKYNVFTSGMINDSAIFVQTVSLNDIPQDYWNNPYPCQLLIQSNGGARYLTLPPPIKPDQKELDALDAQAEAGAGNCYHFYSTFWDYAIFNPTWTPDPPPDGVIQHIWEGSIEGLGPGEQVSVTYGGNQIVGSTRSNQGYAVFSASVTPVLTGPEIGLQRVASEDAAHLNGASVSNDRRITIKQTNLVQQSVIELGGRCIQFIAGAFKWSGSIIFVTSYGIQVFDIMRTAPIMTYQIMKTGINGITRWRNGYLTWSDVGIELLSANLTYVPKQSYCCQDDSIIDVTKFGNYLHVLSRDLLNIYNSGFKKVRSMRVENASHISVVNSTLVVNNKEGLEFYNLTDASDPRSMYTYNIHDVISISPTLAGPNKECLFVQRSNGAGNIFEISQEKAQVINDYVQLPWFVNSVRISNKLAVLDDKHNKVTIYRIYNDAMF